MQKLLAVFVVSLAGMAGALAADPPTVQDILNRYIEATGGRAALEKIKTRVMTGKIEVTTLGVSGDFEVQAKAPDKQVSKLEFGGFGLMREGFDGTVAWTAAPGQGVRAKTGGELARVQRTALFPRELKLSETYAKLEAKGSAKIGDQDTWILEGTPAGGKPERLHFDKKTGLLVREVSLVETQLGEMAFEIELSDYREFDGVKVPCSVRVPKPAEMGFHIKISGVKHNVDIADAAFSKPKS